MLGLETWQILTTDLRKIIIVNLEEQTKYE
jgi:hypothetical protein